MRNECEVHKEREVCAVLCGRTRGTAVHGRVQAYERIVYLSL